MKKALLGTSAAIAVLAAYGYWLFDFTVSKDSSGWTSKPKKEPDPESEKGKRYYHKKKLREDAESEPYEDAWITSEDGLKLHARWYPCENAKRIVICCHGYHGTGCGDFCAALPLIRSDSSILLIDERCASQSEGQYITFGAKEKTDILRWRQYIDEINTEKLPVYLYGISMGASAVLLNELYETPSLNGIIADCGYSSMKEVIGEVMRSRFHSPAYPGIWLLDLYCRLIAGFSMDEADMKEALKQAKIPVLFLHGRKDRLVIPVNTVRNNEACSCEHEVIWFEDAGHAASSLSEPERYQKALYTFFSVREQRNS